MQHDQLEFWIDINLPARLAQWIKEEYNIAAKTFVELNYYTASDVEIFQSAALHPNIVVITTKDYDFVTIKNQQGNKPRILYLNIGNVNNKELRQIFDLFFANALKILIETDQPIVEIKKEI